MEVYYCGPGMLEVGSGKDQSGQALPMLAWQPMDDLEWRVSISRASGRGSLLAKGICKVNLTEISIKKGEGEIKRMDGEGFEKPRIKIHVSGVRPS